MKSKLLNTFIALSVSLSVFYMKDYFKDSNQMVAFAVTLIVGVLVFFILSWLIDLIFYKPSLSEFEGNWLEIIQHPSNSEPSFVSLLQLKYNKNSKSYWINGVSFDNNANRIANWKSEKIYINDQGNLKEIDYIYSAEVIDKKDGDATVKGYAYLDLTNKRGHIIDITNNIKANDKKDFTLLPINRTSFQDYNVSKNTQSAIQKAISVTK